MAADVASLQANFLEWLACSQQRSLHRLQVSVGHLRRSCGACGGALHNTLPADVFTARLRVFASIARHQGFELLAEHCAFLLSGKA
jgi:hypothetical protein